MSLETSNTVVITTDDTSKPVPRGARKCGLCRELGHDKRACPSNTTNSVETATEAPEPTTTLAQAETSASEWLGSGPSIVRTWFVQAIMDPRQHRDIGKFLAQPTEVLVNQWLAEKTGRPIRAAIGVSYDGETADSAKPVRHQVKFRMSAWHFETTRRNSAKNAETNSTGHVAYRKDEFDVLAIFKPGPHFGITGSIIRVIPVTALINPSKPDQLVTSISNSIRKEYDNDEKTEEVLRTMYSSS
jgi:hypothetical protein